jgi:hypothetical protein
MIFVCLGLGLGLIFNPTHTFTTLTTHTMLLRDRQTNRQTKTDRGVLGYRHTFFARSLLPNQTSCAYAVWADNRSTLIARHCMVFVVSRNF